MTATQTRTSSVSGVSSPEASPPEPARGSPRPPGLDMLFTLVFALFGWGVGIGRLSDNSFLWHLRTGGLILDHGIPHADPYSYVAKGTPWVAASWLAELTYGGLDRLAGPFAIRVFVGLVGAAIAVLAFRLALRLAGDRIRAALVTVVALAPLYTIWSERPLLLGVLFFVATLWVVEVPDGPLGRRELIALPVIFWLWANVHGSFALGFVFLGLHVLGRWFEGHPPWEGRERRLVLASVLAFAACFLNPYGVSLVTFPLDLMRRGDALNGVIEWSSPDFHHVTGVAFALWVVVFVVLIARASKRVTVRDLVVTIPFLVLGLWALRNIAIAPLVGLPVAARAIAVPRRSDDSRRGLAWVLVAFVGFVVVVMGVRAAGQPDFALDSYPVKAIDAVERQGLLGSRILTNDADAGYVILRAWPKQQVFMDDRYDMFPLRIIHDFATLNAGRPGWDGVLRRHDVQVVVWGRDRVLSQLLRRDAAWRITYQDHDYVVFVRNDV